MPQLNRVVAPVLVVKQHVEGENCVEEAHVAHVFLLGLFLPLDFVLKRLRCGDSVFDLRVEHFKKGSFRFVAVQKRGR